MSHAAIAGPAHSPTPCNSLQRRPPCLIQRRPALRDGWRRRGRPPVLDHSFPRSRGAFRRCNPLHGGAKRCKCATNARQDALRCCGEDEGRPLGAAFQKEAPKRPLLLRPKDVVVSEWGKAAARPRKVCIGEMSASEPPLDVSKIVGVVETGGVASCREQGLRGVLITAQTTTGI